MIFKFEKKLGFGEIIAAVALGFSILTFVENYSVEKKMMEHEIQKNMPNFVFTAESEKEQRFWRRDMIITNVGSNLISNVQIDMFSLLDICFSKGKDDKNLRHNYIALNSFFTSDMGKTFKTNEFRKKGGINNENAELWLGLSVLEIIAAMNYSTCSGFHHFAKISFIDYMNEKNFFYYRLPSVQEGIIQAKKVSAEEGGKFEVKYYQQLDNGYFIPILMLKDRSLINDHTGKNYKHFLHSIINETQKV